MQQKSSEKESTNIEDVVASLSDDFLGEDIKTIQLAKIAAVQAIQVNIADDAKFIRAIMMFEASMRSKLDNKYKEDLVNEEVLFRKKGSVYCDSLEGRAFFAAVKYGLLMELIDRKKTDEDVLKT